MFRSLILLYILSSSISFAQTSSEILEYSKTNQWNKILYIKNKNQMSESFVQDKPFFLSAKKNWNSHLELKATINAFKNKEKHRSGELAECVFMGRKTLLLRKWPTLFKPSKCKAFEEWFSGLDAGDLYLVFTSAYPNNPASMFGHTFFRMDRKSKGREQGTKELLGYSFSYQARTNPNDSALAYTYKGIAGGYYSFLEIKPHYINVGLYNNSESRDIWEYKLKLTEDEKELFLKHSWEISITGAFEYYFFDENCSTSLLRHLEVIRPNYNYRSKNDLFVVPQVTLREIVQEYNSPVFQNVPSIKRKIENSFVQFSSKQKEKFKKGKSDIHELNQVVDIDVLDTLIDYWKWKNYQKGGNLDAISKKLMILTLTRRAELVDDSLNKKKINIFYQRPNRGHKLSKVSVGGGKDHLWLQNRYGFHDFFDSRLGNPESSHIKFFDFKIEKNKEKQNFNIDVVDILSLQNFYFELPQISWRASLSYYDKDDLKFSKLLGGVGVKKIILSQDIFALLTISSYKTEKMATIHPGVNLGYKWILKELKEGSLDFISELYLDNFIDENILYGRVDSKLKFNKESESYSLNFSKDFDQDRLSLEYSLYY